ncbi:hypothetical protein JVT61DRAFT_904 [Boletus reticuloceps]|uniref:Uncharacterized protein n=1 Tax=Boletus reticuloceps TaxID=495285 RepID=A0A8I3AB18_9AGAM|nr:hypothetical protein JVT61DRAFT_904 [Boletus reticuloceps]
MSKTRTISRVSVLPHLVATQHIVDRFALHSRTLNKYSQHAAGKAQRGYDQLAVHRFGNTNYDSSFKSFDDPAARLDAQGNSETQNKPKQAQPAEVYLIWVSKAPKDFPSLLLSLIQPQSSSYAPRHNRKESEGFDCLKYPNILILFPTLSSAQAATSEMFISNTLVARDDGAGTPPSCTFSSFTIYSNVCVGDMIAIIGRFSLPSIRYLRGVTPLFAACSIAGIGFFFWAIHAIHKMREPPFNDEPEDKEEPAGKNDAGHFPTAFDNSPLVPPDGRTLSPAERVRTRLFLSQPEEPFYRSTLISTDASYAQGSVTTPRMPPRAGGQSHRSSSRSSRHGSLSRGGPSDERREYEHSMNISPSRATGFPAQNDGHGYMRNTSHSRAGSLPADTSSGDYRRQSVRRTNIEPVTYYAY